MARWRADPVEGAPERLCRFVAAEWPGVSPYGPVTEWMQACLDWLGEDSSRRLPFGDDGDALVVIRESARITMAGGSDG